VDLSTYQVEAQRTAGKHPDPMLRIAVCGLGLAGEAAEVLELFRPGSDDPGLDVLTKELGDVAWYAAEAMTVAGLDLASAQVVEVVGGGPGHIAVELCVRCGLLADYLKKVVGHGHALDPEIVRDGVGKVLSLVQFLAADGGTDLPTVLRRNVEKLRARYPGGFSTADSVHRGRG
jgi:NTP pyrophosphatase (non-canonical NTP hydrolase)